MQKPGGRAPAAAPVATEREKERVKLLADKSTKGLGSSDEEHHIISKRWNGNLEEQKRPFSNSDLNPNPTRNHNLNPFVILTLTPMCNLGLWPLP